MKLITTLFLITLTLIAVSVSWGQEEADEVEYSYEAVTGNYEVEDANLVEVRRTTVTTSADILTLNDVELSLMQVRIQIRMMEIQLEQLDEAEEKLLEIKAGMEAEVNKVKLKNGEKAS